VMLIKPILTQTRVPAGIECLAEIEAISGADDHRLRGSKGKAHTRRKRILERNFRIGCSVARVAEFRSGKRQPTGQLCAVGRYSVRVRPGWIEEGEIVVLLAEGRDVIPAQAVVQRELGIEAPTIACKSRPSSLPR